MANRIRTGDSCGCNKGRSSKFREGSRVRQTPEECRRTYRQKRCRNSNKDEDNSLKTFNDKNLINSLLFFVLFCNSLFFVYSRIHNFSYIYNLQIYIYIYREIERGGEREKERQRQRQRDRGRETGAPLGGGCLHLP